MIRGIKKGEDVSVSRLFFNLVIFFYEKRKELKKKKKTYISSKFCFGISTRVLISSIERYSLTNSIRSPTLCFNKYLRFPTYLFIYLFYRFIF